MGVGAEVDGPSRRRLVGMIKLWPRIFGPWNMGGLEVAPVLQTLKFSSIGMKKLGTLY